MSWAADASALQVVIQVCGLGRSNRMDARCLAIHTGDREAEARIMGEPNEVALRIEGDFRDLIEGDARVVGVGDCPLGSVIADEANVASCGYP